MHICKYTRDHDVNLRTMVHDPGHSEEDDATIQRKCEAFHEAMDAWPTWPRRAQELSIAKLDDAITYVFHMHKETDGQFSRGGWNEEYPDRYLWDVDEGLKCMTKLNKCLWMKLYLIRPSVLSFVQEIMPTGPSQNVDGLVGAALQGAIKVARRSDIDDDEVERLRKRKRDTAEIILQPCRDYPNKCAKADRCKYVHATR